MLNNMTIAKKSGAAFLFLALICIASSLVIINFVIGAQTAETEMKHSDATLRKIIVVSKAVDNQTLALKNFLLSGNRDWIESYDKHQQAASDAIGKLEADEYVAHYQPGFVESFKAKWAVWKNEFAAPQIEMMNDPETVDLAKAIAVSGEAEAKQREIFAAVADARMSLQATNAQNQSHVRDALQWTLYAAIAAAVVVAFSALAFFVMFQSHISRPLTRSTELLERLASGQLDVEIPQLDRRDEIGTLTDVLVAFKSNASENARLVAEQEQLKREAERQRKEEMRELANEFDARVGQIISRVANASTELSSTAEGLIEVATQTGQEVSSVAQASDNASTNVHSVAAAAEQLTASISEISHQTRTAFEAAKKGAQGVESASARMAQLEQSIEQIGDVVNLISEIAGQTNLLALNATIESARAGEEGKGFAVVASEVKNLASKTTEATEGIRRQIEEIQTTAKDSVEGMGEMLSLMSSIEEISSGIASAIEEQDATAREIAANMSGAAEGASSITRSMEAVSRATENSNTASSQVATSASDVSSEAQLLKKEVEQFIEHVRAA
ncbi:MAG: methyl-accepting chemotaxis protein [Filomicrobium sp.]